MEEDMYMLKKLFKVPREPSHSQARVEYIYSPPGAEIRGASRGPVPPMNVKSPLNFLKFK
jgi:hypothetical protein